MNNNSGTQDMAGMLAEALERIGELERKVLALGDEPPADEGCCTVLCCDSAPAATLTTGQADFYCETPLEDTAGNATRIVVIGFVTVHATGAGNLIWDLAASVDGAAYLYRPRCNRTVLSGDQFSLTVVNTIDTSSTAPVVSLKVRNLSTVSFVVDYANVVGLVYGVRDGSAACGEAPGTE